MDWLSQNWVYLLLLCVMFMVSRGRMRGGIGNHIPALAVRISVTASSLSEHLDPAGFPSELQNLGPAFNPEIER